MSRIRTQACAACPYRRDVASGVWAAEEYDKLVAYDAPTAEQPIATFQCHATPDFYCHGWAVVHSNRGSAYELLALRFALLRGPVGQIPEPAVPLFESGAEAAEHGKRSIAKPTRRARKTMDRLKARYPRLRGQSD